MKFKSKTILQHVNVDIWFEHKLQPCHDPLEVLFFWLNVENLYENVVQKKKNVENLYENIYQNIRCSPRLYEVTTPTQSCEEIN